jgi:serine/threonine protein kinase/tetratricopeptide (TPR) repeat protein
LPTFPGEVTILPAENAEPDIESLEQIFETIAYAPKSRHESLLADLCPDPEVQGLVRELLRADSSDGLVIDTKLFPDPVELRLGDQIGPYKLLQKIGEGGMGVVYMAEQSVPVRRKVALKIIKPGIDSKQVLARFSAERQALSMLDHPNIAKVLDVGATESGRPYFVMELVKGRSITQYCQELRLPLRDKLIVLMSVCHAIQHAHQKGIIHRDLKPSNVLVAEYDGRPVAKVIDFGVAKAIESPLTEITLFTGFGQIVGTLEYMSPEQSRMNQLDVDVRSDVYSLGVLFYELITGSTPISKARMRTAAWDEMLRIIREEDPPIPSKRLSDWERNDNEIIPDSHQTRSSQAERQRLSLTVRGELDWIVMKALDKDRTRRYASPSELARDIDCYLNGDIVSACPPSVLYRCQKLFKRNKLAVLTCGLVAISLILGLVGTTWQAWRATAAERIASMERDLAKEQAEKAAQAERVAQRESERFRVIDEFVQMDLLGLEKGTTLLLPTQTGDPNVTLGQLLDRARDRLSDPSGSYQNRPNSRQQLKLWLVRSYSSISRFAEATILLEEIVADLRKIQGDENDKPLQYIAILAQLYTQQYRWWDALALHQEALVDRQRLLGETHPDALNSMHNVANTFRLLGLYEQSAELYRTRLEMAKPSDDAAEIAEYQARLGGVLGRIGQLAEAEPLLRQAIESFRQQGNVVKQQNALSELGMTLLRNQRFSEARQDLAEAYELSKQLDLTDGELAQRQFIYAVACLMAPENGTPLDPSLAIQESLNPLLQKPIVVMASAMDDLQLLANCLQQNGKADEAERLLQRAIQVLDRYSFHGTRRSAILADLAAIAQHRSDQLKTKELLLQAVECLTDTDKYPNQYNQNPDFEVQKRSLSNALAERLVQVHRELGDQVGAEVWQEKLK